MKKFNVREIETFELSKDYYLNSWINGNKTHVKDELSELFLCSPQIAMAKIIELPKDIAQNIIDSQQFKDVNLALFMKAMGMMRKYTEQAQ